MKKQNSIGVILAAVLAVLCVVASIFYMVMGGRKAKAQTTVTTTEGTEEPVEFDWYINYSWYRDGWGSNVVSQKITRDTGVSIRFVTPVGDDSATLDTMMSSDTLPDLITLGYWEPQFSELITGGQVYALNALADQYDPLFYDVADADSVRWYTMSDGNIYGYPNSSYTRADYNSNQNLPSNQVFMVRKDIYEAIGSPDMTTPEGFANAVRKAAEMFPVVDGEPMIPIGSNFFDDNGCTSFDQYLQNSLAVPFEKDGLFYDRNMDPEYLEWLKVYRQLNEEGYISRDIFVDARTQITEKILSGRYFCMFYQWTDMADQEKEIFEHNPERVYIAVDGPRNKQGDDPVLPTNSVQGWTVTMISKNCKNPRKAIQFLDYMISEEGQKSVYLGELGKTYEIGEDGLPRFLPEVQELLSTDRVAFNEKYGADNTYWMLQDNIMQMKWQQPAIEPLLRMQKYTLPYATYVGQYTISIPENTSIGRKYVNVLELWSETLKKLLLAPSDEAFDAIVEDYKAQRESLGFAEVEKEQTRQMQENKERLGIVD